jgi:hypothetical protein
MSDSIPGERFSCAALAELIALAQRLESQIDSAHGEIGETRSILKDAIDRLMPAFTTLRPNDAAPAMSPSKREAFSALQFQDISDQLLAHAQSRLACLHSTVHHIADSLKDADAKHVDRATLNSLIERANDQLTELDVAFVKPVSKAHLGTGDMELF